MKSSQKISDDVFSFLHKRHVIYYTQFPTYLF